MFFFYYGIAIDKINDHPKRSKNERFQLYRLLKARMRYLKHFGFFCVLQNTITI